MPARRQLVFLLIVALASSVAAAPGYPSGLAQVPESGLRGAIDEPSFVAASEARMRPETWVLGVVIDDPPRAYGLELLGRHAVVNDSAGDTVFAVAWSPHVNAALVFNREAGGRTLDFEPAEGLLYGALVLRDRQTGSHWSIMTGRAESGPMAGTTLDVLPVSDRMSWAAWAARNPDTRVLSVTPRPDDASAAAEQDPGTDLYADYFASAAGYAGVTATDPRLDTKDMVYGFRRGGVAYAVDIRGVIGGNSYTVQDGSHILVYREAGDDLGHASAAFVSRAGFEQRGGSWFELAADAEFNAITRDFGGAAIERLNGFDTFWYAWSLSHPDTELLR